MQTLAQIDALVAAAGAGAKRWVCRVTRATRYNATTGAFTGSQCDVAYTLTGLIADVQYLKGLQIGVAGGTPILDAENALIQQQAAEIDALNAQIAATAQQTSADAATAKSASDTAAATAAGTIADLRTQLATAQAAATNATARAAGIQAAYDQLTQQLQAQGT